MKTKQRNFSYLWPALYCTIFKTFTSLQLIGDRGPVALLVVHRAVTREVVSSRLRPDQHSGSLNN